MKKLIIRFPGAMAVAITLILTGSSPLCAQLAPDTDYFPRVYYNARRLMQNEARAVGLRIDTDVDTVVEPTGHVLMATIDGFENIVLDDTGPNEFDFGFVGVGGIEGLPDGYYRLHYLVDLTHPEDAIVLLINSQGQVFTYPVEVADDSHPERGSRKGLTSEGGTFVGIAAHVPTRSRDYKFEHGMFFGHVDGLIETPRMRKR
jgi:hypothetical protein